MTTRNVIASIELERVEDLSTRVLPLWELEGQAPVSAPAMPWLPLSSFRVEQLQPPLQGASTFTVVCTNQRPRLVDDFVDWATGLADARTYLVGPEEWAGSPPGQALLKRGRTSLLVRLGAEPPGDWILADQGRAGWLMVGPPGAPRSWVLPLDAALARSLYEATTLLFWHHTTREAVPEPKGSARFVACLPSPFPPPNSNPVPLSRGSLLLQGGAETPLLPNAEVVVDPGRRGPEGEPKLLVMPPAVDTFDQMAALTSRGVNVVWFDQQLPRLAVSRQRMVMALEEGASRLHLHFGPQEAIPTLQALERCAIQGAWRFHSRRALSEVRGQVRTTGSAEERSVHDEVLLHLGDITANELASLEQTTPTGWPSAAELARRVRYRWRVLPPRPPAGNRPAQLCHQWSTLDEFVDRRVAQLRTRLDKVEREEQEDGLLSRLAGLLSRWTNVRSQRKRLRQAVDEVAEQPLSKRPEEAEALLQRLAAHEEELGRLESECRREVDEEERRVEEERQRKDHEAQIARARARRDEVMGRLAELRQELDSKRGELEAAKSEADRYALDLERSRHEEQLLRDRARLEEFQTQLMTKDAQAEHIRAQVEAPQAEPGDSSSKAARKQLKKDLHAIDEQRKQLSREAEQLRRRIEAPFTPDPRQPLPGPDARLEKLLTGQKELGERLGALEKQASAYEQERVACERVLDQPFQPRFIPRPAAAPWKAPAFRPPPVPDEALPETGVLLEHGGRRYLAITSWPQVPRAQPIAVRLKAQLVAIEPSP